MTRNAENLIMAYFRLSSQEQLEVKKHINRNDLTTIEKALNEQLSSEPRKLGPNNQTGCALCGK